MVLARDSTLEEAEKWLAFLQNYSLVVSRSSLLKAVLFKNAMRVQKISFFDAVGYTFAREQGIPFVTGDKEFKGLPGVEFVPK